MERSLKLRKLETTRRKLPHASAAFFSAVLKSVKDDPSLLEGPSRRQDFQQARNAVVLEDTSFGPMLVKVQVSKIDNTLMDVHVAHPFAVLDFFHYKTTTSKNFSSDGCALSHVPWMRHGT